MFTNTNKENGGWDADNSCHTASIARAAWQGVTNRHANEINPSVCKQDWWGAAVGSRGLARALRAEQVTTLIVCSYSFDIDEEGAAHNGSSATLTILLSGASCRCYCCRVGSQGSCPRQGLLAPRMRTPSPNPLIPSNVVSYKWYSALIYQHVGLVLVVINLCKHSFFVVYRYHTKHWRCRYTTPVRISNISVALFLYMFLF